MHKEFVPYNVALAMKGLGFDKVCFAWYSGAGINLISIESAKNGEGWLLGQNCSAPLYQQAFRWLREEFGIDVCIVPKFGDNGYGAECFKNGSLLPVELLSKHNYREAQEACLRKLIEIVKEK